MAKKRWGIDVFPSLTDLKIAEDAGISPDAYCKALNAEEDYQQQIDAEDAARGGSPEEE